MMNEKEVERLLQCLDGSGTDNEWAAAERLRTLGNELPRLLLARFRTCRTWKARTSCVYHAVRYAVESEDAVQLGLEAIRDKSKVVRYRGAMLLAYSQRMDVVPQLRAALEALGHGNQGEDLLAAIDAIEAQNHNFFVDRDHSGKVRLTIG